MSTIDLVVSITILVAIVVLIAYIVAVIDMHYMYKRINRANEHNRIIELLKRQ